MKMDFSMLNKFIAGLGTKTRVRVGLFGDKSSRESAEGGASATFITNPELGAIQELGSFSRGIPPRSFLRAPILQHADEIVQRTQETALSLIAAGKWKQVMRWLGFYCEQFVQDAFDTSGGGTWPPNKPATIRRKGSDKPLIDSAQMRHAVTSKVMGADK